MAKNKGALTKGTWATLDLALSSGSAEAVISALAHLKKEDVDLGGYTRRVDKWTTESLPCAVISDLDNENAVKVFKALDKQGYVFAEDAGRRIEPRGFDREARVDSASTVAFEKGYLTIVVTLKKRGRLLALPEEEEEPTRGGARGFRRGNNKVTAWPVFQKPVEENAPAATNTLRERETLTTLWELDESIVSSDIGSDERDSPTPGDPKGFSHPDSDSLNSADLESLRDHYTNHERIYGYSSDRAQNGHRGNGRKWTFCCSRPATSDDSPSISGRWR